MRERRGHLLLVVRAAAGALAHRAARSRLAAARRARGCRRAARRRAAGLDHPEAARRPAIACRPRRRAVSRRAHGALGRGRAPAGRRARPARARRAARDRPPPGGRRAGGTVGGNVMRTIACWRLRSPCSRRPASAQQPGVMGTWLTRIGRGAGQDRALPDAASGADLRHHRRADQSQGTGRQGRGAGGGDRLSQRRSGAAQPQDDRHAADLGLQEDVDPNTFEGGKIYNGENGKTYSANISLQPDGKLRLRGYVGTPMFGETQLWTRVSQ